MEVTTEYMKISNYLMINKDICRANVGQYYVGCLKNDIYNEVMIRKISQDDLSDGFTADKIKNHILDVKTYFKYQHLLKIIDCISTAKQNIYIITEKHSGKTLQNYISKVAGERLSARKAKTFIYQLFKGLSYLSEFGNMHITQIPLSSIIVSDDESSVKLDYLPFVVKSGNYQYYMYTAPEELEKSSYDSSAWIWCLGVIFYRLTCSIEPWRRSNKDDYLQDIQKEPIKFPGDCALVGEDKILIEKMLQISPEKRLKIAELENFFDKYFEKDLEEKSLQNKENNNNQELSLTKKSHPGFTCSYCIEDINGLRYVGEGINYCRDCIELQNVIYDSYLCEIPTPISSHVKSGEIITEFTRNIYEPDKQSKDLYFFDCTDCKKQQKYDEMIFRSSKDPRKKICFKCATNWMSKIRLEIDQSYLNKDNNIYGECLYIQPTIIYQELSEKTTSILEPKDKTITVGDEMIQSAYSRLSEYQVMYHKKTDRSIIILKITGNRTNGDLIADLKFLFEKYKNLRSNNIPFLVNYYRKIGQYNEYKIELSFQHMGFYNIKDQIKSTTSLMTKFYVFTQIIQTIAWMHRNEKSHEFLCPQFIYLDKQYTVSIIGLECLIWDRNIKDLEYYGSEYEDKESPYAKKKDRFIQDYDADIYSIGKLCDWLFNQNKSSYNERAYFKDLIKKCTRKERMYRFSIDDLVNFMKDCKEYISNELNLKVRPMVSDKEGELANIFAGF